MTEILVKHISGTLSISKPQVSNTVKLLEEGATIPFISRYRKEATGSLDETEVTAIEKEWKRLLELVKRREAILKSINDQELLTPELEVKINNCWNMAELEDIYLPYKLKRKTRASAAREKGLEPLAEIIMTQKEDKLEAIVSKYLNDEVPDIEAALAGARDIIAEWINENTDARNKIRHLFERDAIISSKVIEKKKDEGTKYQDYFDFSEPLERCAGHRLLAIRRAEQEGILRVSISIDNENAIENLEKIFIKNKNESAVQVGLSIKDAHKRLLAPSIETEFKNSSKAKADEEAIRVFSENLRQLLLSPPLGPKVTMAIDPGFRTGCKLVCLDQQGNLLHHDTIYPHPPQPKLDEATGKIKGLLKKYKVEAIAIGNGTAGRETERFIKSLIGETSTIEIFVVNEAGASIYSASETAREEFPDLDLTFRGAISIGRRLMDPLAELVKIDAKSIGVGQYQHDVNQDDLKDGLDKVVTSAVNQVGVNLNTASQHLLSYVSGIGPKLAKSIIKYRRENKTFRSRKELIKVSGLGAKAFEQSAGFLRIPGAENPLDNSAVHPESYSIVAKMAKDLSQPVKSLIEAANLRQQIDINNYVTDTVGLPTLKDIMQELEKPGLDPRGKAEVFSFSETINEITDLKPGMRLPGIVTNLTKFGAFVNIGIKENGLLHISQITDRFIKDLSEVLKLDQKIMVRVVEIDIERKRIQLSMKEG
ncbi:MAG: RNA-binding transcriptional accessory protein [Ignavibacteriales bacterium]|nr:RNA-binding transcriptional accessory protein [Ignavibacteriales bacterium]